MPKKRVRSLRSLLWTLHFQEGHGGLTVSLLRGWETGEKKLRAGRYANLVSGCNERAISSVSGT